MTISHLTKLTVGSAIPSSNGSGLSAYQIAQQNGFIGSQTDWLASLIGPQGPMGPTGYPGAAGMNAPSGYPTVLTTTDGRKLPVDELMNFMETMKRRMLMLTPAFEKHERYPALKAAYDAYVVMEKLCDDNDETEQ